MNFNPMESLAKVFRHKHMIAYYCALLVSTKSVAIAMADFHGGNELAGWAGAIALDLGMLSLSERVAQLRKSGKHKGKLRMLWSVLVFFTAMSIAANLYSSLKGRYGEITVETFAMFDEFVFSAATMFGALMPIIALSLSGYKPKEQDEEVQAQAKSTPKSGRPAAGIEAMQEAAEELGGDIEPIGIRAQSLEFREHKQKRKAAAAELQLGLAL